MERLTKHWGNNYVATKLDYCSLLEIPDEDFKCFEVIVKKLAEYEDLEEQGRLIKLPCKPGKNLYDIIEFVEGYESPDIFIIDASRIEISKDKEGLIYTIDGADYREKDFGTVLFTSEEEALKAISEKGWIL